MSRRLRGVTPLKSESFTQAWARQFQTRDLLMGTWPDAPQSGPRSTRQVCNKTPPPPSVSRDLLLLTWGSEGHTLAAQGSLNPKRPMSPLDWGAGGPGDK